MARFDREAKGFASGFICAFCFGAASTASQSSVFNSAWLGAFTGLGCLAGALCTRPDDSSALFVRAGRIHTTLKVSMALVCLSFGQRSLPLAQFLLSLYSGGVIERLLRSGRPASCKAPIALLCTFFALLFWSLPADGGKVREGIWNGLSVLATVAARLLWGVGGGLGGRRSWREVLYAVTLIGIVGLVCAFVLRSPDVGAHSETPWLPFILFFAGWGWSWAGLRKSQGTPSMWTIAGYLCASLLAFVLMRGEGPVLAQTRFHHGLTVLSFFVLHVCSNRVDQIYRADTLARNSMYADPFSSLIAVGTATEWGWLKVIKSERERKLAAFLLLTLAIMLLEFFYGISINSLSLVSDSFHMMLDAASIVIGLYAAHAASWPSNPRVHPSGYSRYEVLSGFVNGVLLIFIALYVMMESVERILDPPEISASYLLSVSVIGLLVNVVGVVFFHEAHGHTHSHSHGHEHTGCGHGAHTDHNMRGVYLHILADLLGSVSVIVSCFFIKTFNWWLADPICSMVSAGLILASAFPLLEETGKILLLCAPHQEKAFDQLLLKELMDTLLVSHVESIKAWVHSTPPRELIFCAVSAKLHSEVDYTTARGRLTHVIKNSAAHHLGTSKTSVILHLE